MIAPEDAACIAKATGDAERALAEDRPRHEVHRLRESDRGRPRTRVTAAESAHGPRAGRVDDGACADLEPLFGEGVANPNSLRSTGSDEDLSRFRVVGGFRPGVDRRAQDREEQTFRIQHQGVVPKRPAGEPLLPDAGREP